MLPCETLKKIRQEYNLTQKEAWNLLGMPRRTWESWESGERKPAEWMLKLVVEMLEIKIKEKENEKMFIEEMKKANEGKVKYIAARHPSDGCGEFIEKYFDFIDDANKEAQEDYEHLTKAEREAWDIKVLTVTINDLNDEAFIPEEERYLYEGMQNESGSYEDGIEWANHHSYDISEDAWTVEKYKASLLEGTHWGNLNVEEEEFLTKEINAVDGVTGNNMRGDGECIVDLTAGLSVPGEIIDGEIVIADDAVIYNPSK